MAGRCLPPAHISLISGAKSVNDLYGAWPNAALLRLIMVAAGAGRKAGNE
jgi:hypothetical protein